MRVRIERRKASELGYKYKKDIYYYFVSCPDCGISYWVPPADIGKRVCKKCGYKKRSRIYYRENHPSWKGGRRLSYSGYIDLYIYPDNPFYPMARRDGYVREHRYIMAKHLGRCLSSWEIVHHINSKRDDNRLENLELFPLQAEHLSSTKLQQRVKELEKRVILLEAEIAILRSNQTEEVVEWQAQ